MKALGKLVAFALFPAATPARAGIANSPLPELLPSAPTFHLYSVPGAIGGAGGLGTYFACTSTDTAVMQVDRWRWRPGLEEMISVVVRWP